MGGLLRMFILAASDRQRSAGCPAHKKSLQTKNSDLEGIGVLNHPGKTSFFLFGGVHIFI